jgi:nitrite reductase/ring-hydroxylating ferredoxin subunit
MAKLLKIAKTKDVPPGQAAPFTIEGQKIALFNVEGTYYAIGDTCTHRGGPLKPLNGQRMNSQTRATR